MVRSLRIIGIFSIILVLALLCAGCSDSTEPAPADTVAPATTAGPLYTAGDIVRSASGSESPAWLVLGYEGATDSYTRALIYKNADGSYGYRTGKATDTAKRATMEKVMTVKIAHVDAATIPTVAPTTVTTEVTVAATKTFVAATTSATTTATTSTTKPKISGMDPDHGEAGTRVVTEIKGSGFVKDLTAELRHKGEENIKASSVSWYSDKSVTATFLLPNTSVAGAWDILVTNPNGLSDEYTNYFSVQGNKSGPL